MDGHFEVAALSVKVNRRYIAIRSFRHVCSPVRKDLGDPRVALLGRTHERSNASGIAQVDVDAPPREQG